MKTTPPLETEERPWGRYDVLLDEDCCKVKKITVNPHARLSYQKHLRREEVWTIVQGTAIITLDGQEMEHSAGDVIHIPKEAAHRIANTKDETVIFIEIQRGDYFGEDDIIRIEDDYGRHV
ncbi:MAG: phosphomannose isomerase type II C-terminal cupin domain [Candidatus Margulisbacteria bacterium]|nr:phosphomannose isomerase type II C-terminal cupin domain [Candidatus Margulisiibacteriota bacterium]